MAEYPALELAEVEFRPEDSRQAIVRREATDPEEIELDRLVRAKRSSMQRLMQSSRLAGESALRKLRMEGMASEGKGQRRLVPPRSTTRTRLKTLQEEDESSAPETELTEGNSSLSSQSFEKEAYVEEIL